jgi:hypothetical protein
MRDVIIAGVGNTTTRPPDSGGERSADGGTAIRK